MVAGLAGGAAGRGALGWIRGLVDGNVDQRRDPSRTVSAGPGGRVALSRSSLRKEPHQWPTDAAPPGRVPETMAHRCGPGNNDDPALRLPALDEQHLWASVAVRPGAGQGR